MEEISAENEAIDDKLITVQIDNLQKFVLVRLNIRDKFRITKVLKEACIYNQNNLFLAHEKFLFKKKNILHLIPLILVDLNWMYFPSPMIYGLETLERVECPKFVRSRR